MSTDTKVTVAGWVGTQPKHFVSENGTDFTTFRLASTKRYYNRAEDRWVDGPTTWFTVKTWRTTALNVAESLRKSDPVVVHGSLSSDEWTSPEGPRTTFVIEADSLGPDLSRGQATFRHTVQTRPLGVGPDGPGQTSPDGGEHGLVADTSAPDDASSLLQGSDPWTVHAPGDGDRPETPADAADEQDAASSDDARVPTLAG